MLGSRRELRTHEIVAPSSRGTHQCVCAVCSDDDVWEGILKVVEL